MPETPVTRRPANADLPGMVRWYDPRLLMRIGIRTIVSSVFGQYADQRLLQAATDQATSDALVKRHDYSDPHADNPAQRIAIDQGGAYWIDYLADTADGFLSTYTMASLLTAPALDVPEAGLLPAGTILIMGGDQCYPQATREEYKQRLLQPFDMACRNPQEDRKLFAIPGNHDWYDGLAAFDGLFCASRDRLSDANPTRIGTWACPQHRSYWALKLPNRWWIWGTDIQFSRYLDQAQVNYFRTIAAQMGPEDKVVICIAEPSWMLAEMQGQDPEQNFFHIVSIARSRNAQVCAVLAGDWHHYNRYFARDIGVHFFTAGGGGAFLHPTHVLSDRIQVAWPQQHTWSATESGAIVAGASTVMQPEKVDIELKQRATSAMGRVRGAVQDTLRTLRPRLLAAGAGESSVGPGDAKCYPSKSTSWTLSLRNFLFPLFNFPFAIGIGVVYWILTWTFHTVARQHDISAGKIDHVDFATLASLLPWMPLYVLQATLSVSFSVLLVGMWGILVAYVDAVERPAWRRWTVKLGIGTAHFLAHALVAFTLFLTFMASNNALSPKVTEIASSWLREDPAAGGIVRSIVRETLEPVSQRRTDQRKAAESEQTATRTLPPPPTTAPGGDLVGPTTMARRSAHPDAVREIVGLLYPVQMTLIGGLIGGFLWGCYWVLTGLLGRMHAEDAFAALRIKDYKCFLRMRFDADTLTIYPIGVDRVPRMGEWMEPAPGEAPPHGPALVPKSGRIPVHLIEAPIVITASGGPGS